MKPEQRQKALLAGLLIVLLLVAGRSALRTIGGGRGGSGGAEAGGAVRGDEAVASVETLRLADLEFEPQEFKVGRNPFWFGPAPRRPAPKPEPVRTPQPRPARERRPQPTTSPRPAGPKPPPVDVVYLGRFGPVGRPIAVFSDGKEIFNSLEGGVLKEKFVVDKIGYESADLKFVGFPDTPAERLAVGG